jgi:hypothetical protein
MAVDMSKWTPEQRDAYERATAEAEYEAASLAAEKAQRDAAASSPEALIEAAREKAAAAKKEREKAAREAEDDAAFKAAVRAQGGEHRVARVRTYEGSIVLRAAGKLEWTEFQERVGALQSDEDKLSLARSMTLDTVLHPARHRVLELCDRFPGLWIYLYGARDALVDGLEQQSRGKG